MLESCCAGDGFWMEGYERNRKDIGRVDGDERT